MTTVRNCPECGLPLPANVRAGLCPRCVMVMNVATPTGMSGEMASVDWRLKSPPPTPSELAPKFPQLEIIEFIGQGGMGLVYKARQKGLDRVVALKLLGPEREKDPQFGERFVREARTLAQLSHPNIVTVHDFGESGGLFYLLMEYVDGVNLRQLLRQQKLSPKEALAIVPVICDALQFAHDRGVVHRDIKPENILLDKEGRIKIADFGIARILGREGGAGTPGGEMVAGTPQYMAPEQKSAPERADNRSDIYSLGVVFYELLTGEVPREKFQPPSHKVQMDVRLDEIVLRALEKSPELRYQTARELRTEVETIASTPGRRRGGAFAISGAGSVLLGLALLLGALAAGWILLKKTNRSHQEQYARAAARIPALQEQWTAAKARESIARQRLSWFQALSTNGQNGEELRESQRRGTQLQSELEDLIRHGDDLLAQIEATSLALAQLRYPLAQVAWPVALMLLVGFLLIFRGSARRSPAWPLVAIPASVVIVLLVLLMFLFSHRQATPLADRIQISGHEPADSPPTKSP